ncbi:tetratricopeptide repeat protein [Kordia sp. SMS9]|uniref:tetratricopeptide repeat protein n=1 Tax=Kordia sp. SMS9 TaxID=2282170 RepID=UPI000E0D73E2|nr:tetratricopeptide repeat protein [Kordia sp. SMS9]AXG71936.1 tetratricopeptide repeat protein [Kordia sp. SMS9]
MAIELTKELLAQIDGYLRNTLSTTEKEAFEKRLHDEPEFQEEVRLQQQLFDILGKKEWYTIQKSENKERIAELKSKIRSKEYQGLSANIRNAEAAYLNENTKVKPLQKYYKYMAIAAVLILFFGIYITQMNTSYSSYYETYVDWSELPSFVEKGSEKDIFILGETAFKQKKYEEALTIFQKITPTDEFYTHSLVYLGASYDLLDENEKAIATFQKLANAADPYIRSKGNWYTAMLYLKMENKEKAMEALQKNAKITERFKSDETTMLLNTLK